MGLLGSRVRRTEDPALLVGAGRYVADIVHDDALHAVFVRSVEPHGEIRAIHADDARCLPGVVAVFTADDLGIQPVAPSPPMLDQVMVRSALARDRVRYVGEAVAVVLATSAVAAAAVMVLGRQADLGIGWLWGAIWLFMAARSILLGLRFVGDRWQVVGAER